MLIVSLFLLWVVVILLVVAVIALSRQVRLLQDRAAPPVHAHASPQRNSANEEKADALAPLTV